MALSAYNYAGTPATQYESRQLSCNVGGIGFGPYWCGALPQAKNLGPLNQAGTPDIISWYVTMNPTIYNILINNSLAGVDGGARVAEVGVRLVRDCLVHVLRAKVLAPSVALQQRKEKRRYF